MTTNNKVYQLGCRLGVQGPRPQPSDRGWVGKSVTRNRPQQQLDGKTKGLRVAKEELTVGTHSRNMECENIMGNRPVGVVTKRNGKV